MDASYQLQVFLTISAAQLDRLPTRARLAAWGLKVQTANSAFENRDHMLLRCGFSVDIWARVLHRLGSLHHSFYTWTSLTEWLAISTTTHHLFLKRIAPQATIYHIWWERNMRLHDNSSSTSAQTFKNIDRGIRVISVYGKSIISVFHVFKYVIYVLGKL